MPLFSAQSRREEPYPPMSKIGCGLTLVGQDAKIISQLPVGFKREFYWRAWPRLNRTPLIYKDARAREGATLDGDTSHDTCVETLCNEGRDAVNPPPVGCT